MPINKNISKILNYKSISSLYLIGAGLFFSNQSATAMLKNILSSSSKTVQSLSSNSNQPVKYFYGSNGKRAIFAPVSPTSATPYSNPKSEQIHYFYGSNGKRALPTDILQSSSTTTVPQNTSSIRTSSSTSNSTTQINNNSSSITTNKNPDKHISNLLNEISKFTKGIKGVSDDYASLSKQIRSHIDELQQKSKK